MSDRLSDRIWRVGLRVAYRGLLVWWRVRRPHVRGACVAVWHADRVLVIENSYRRRLGLPAGGIARGESPRDCAARELFEEVGIAVAPEALRYVGEITDDVGPAHDHAHVFELECDEEPRVEVDGREVVAAAFLHPDEALARGVVRVVRTYLEARDTPP